MTTEAPERVVHARAPGKLNVYLGVGTLQEDGYHEVATAYQAVSLYEEVRASPAPDFSVSFTGSVDLTGLSTDGSNLAIRAATLLARRTGWREGVRLEIDKNVPVAGGMGGGSADAAATLLACDALWGTGLSRDDLLGLAAELGADVPFALLGGTAVGTGRGDQLSPALAQGHYQWVLALADFGMSTPEVYRELDRHRERHAGELSPVLDLPHVETTVLQALRAGDPHMLAACMHNDLQAAALHLEPRLAEVLELGEENGALAGIVSGSGPTVAFLAVDNDAALALQVALSASGKRVVRASGPVHGARVTPEP
ncbi:4-(cytidine 5'-diphospho)-2-C-methyl-D-erythritol kinase [Cryobacterium sp. BB736]|uniref:4-(cytidine 5'-diphospho)-2-C-methyl-D-erythritol kinase n=1 Tax=Cryobacterium sp. BB736 TaxID=2746963 RepID=UPI0018767551|nr:4-(cytidine 5'-diphospho)-2-C-methyl-D-erythritol kinase [Cryobacterium sp. BB736]